MNQFRIESKNRRRVTRTLTVVAIGVAAAVSLNAGNVLAQAPKAPVTINVVDVAGNLALTQDAMRPIAKKNPNLVAKINFTKAPAPELAGQAEGDAGRGTQRHRSRADRHRLPRRRHRAGTAA